MSWLNNLFYLDGGYSEWSVYSNCSVSCDNETGIRVRTRKCNSPEPAENGLDCVTQGLGNSTEEVKCNGTIATQSSDPTKECYTIKI